MATIQASSGAILDVRPLAVDWAAAQTETILEADRFELVRVVLPAGDQVASRAAQSDMTVQCLEGRVRFQAAG